MSATWWQKARSTSEEAAVMDIVFRDGGSEYDNATAHFHAACDGAADASASWPAGSVPQTMYYQLVEDRIVREEKANVLRRAPRGAGKKSKALRPRR